jgi:hypothetical protein
VRTGFIADLFASRNDRQAVAALALAALESLRISGAGMGVTLAVPGTALYATLRRLGFFSASVNTSFSFEAVPLGDVEAASLGGAGDWHVAGGDSDVI